MTEKSVWYDNVGNRTLEEKEINKTKKEYTTERSQKKTTGTFNLTVSSIYKEDIKTREYPSGLMYIQLKHLTPESILPQIPLEDIAWYFEHEMVRKTLLGQRARTVFKDIEKKVKSYNEGTKERFQKKIDDNLIKNPSNSIHDESNSEMNTTAKVKPKIDSEETTISLF